MRGNKEHVVGILDTKIYRSYKRVVTNISNEGVTVYIARHINVAKAFKRH